MDKNKIRKIKKFLFPILVDYYGHGETHREKKNYAQKDWEKLLGILKGD